MKALTFLFTILFSVHAVFSIMWLYNDVTGQLCPLWLHPSCGFISWWAYQPFNSTCSSILDTVAPPKTKRTKSLRQPWLNETTCALRRKCSHAERKWKKDKLEVSVEILYNCLSKYRKTVKTAKSAFLSGLIWTNFHKPRALFNIFNSDYFLCHRI